MSQTPTVNTHVHTPCSFSAYESIEEILADALREGVAALSVSDFNCTDAFDRWAALCANAPLYPLFSIECIALSQKDKAAGARWNDPGNPGVMYFCGKALRQPARFSASSRDVLARLHRGSQRRIAAMIDALNRCCDMRGLSTRFSYDAILAEYAAGTVRERHLAKALYRRFHKEWPDPLTRLEQYRRLFDDASFEADLADSAGMQNTIRSRLLKAGKPAYVEEREDAFLPPARVRELVLDGGGIPCYPVLADDSATLNEHERDPDALADTLEGMGVYAVEFIPQRNSLELLKRYVGVFRARGFCITFGTEHNTPARISLVPAARGGVGFDDALREIAFEGAGIMAAHQELLGEGAPGFVDASGARLVDRANLSAFARRGQESIIARARTRSHT